MSPTNTGRNENGILHCFSRSVICETTVSDERPSKGESHIQELKWTGRPKRKHLAEYRRWVRLIAQLLTDRWKARVLYGLGVTPICTEFWGFEPKGTPKLMQKVPLGIP
jgi:hypothetical protein